MQVVCGGARVVIQVIRLGASCRRACCRRATTPGQQPPGRHNQGVCGEGCGEEGGGAGAGVHRRRMYVGWRPAGRIDITDNILIWRPPPSPPPPSLATPVSGSPQDSPQAIPGPPKSPPRSTPRSTQDPRSQDDWWVPSEMHNLR